MIVTSNFLEFLKYLFKYVNVSLLCQSISFRYFFTTWIVKKRESIPSFASLVSSRTFVVIAEFGKASCSEIYILKLLVYLFFIFYGYADISGVSKYVLDFGR